ncbi:MAG: Gfo/Idh/MocA family oxidoreductase [Cytophagales bacterium]|nr:Gfo/Idh/MocA family oxidoreductase [Cytophagales bacterium]
MRPIPTALLSYGMSGEVFHAPLLHAHAGFEITSVVQRTKSTANQHYPTCKVVRTVDEVLADPAIELVIVNTPNELHFNQASRALLAGKHVVVEKPFTVSTHEADQLIELATEKNRVLTVFQNRRWDGDFLTLKHVIDSGWVGRVVELEAHYDRFRNHIEPDTWKEEAGSGKGILYNLGSHMLDQAVVLLGMPEYVDARIGIQRTGGKVDDFYDLRLTYAGVNVIVKSSYLVRQPGPRYQLHGTEGSFVTASNVDPQEQALKEKKIPGSPGWGSMPEETWGLLNTTLKGEHVHKKIETVAGNYSGFYDNVYAAIRQNKPLQVKPEQARDVIRLIEASYESNREKRAVKL